MKRARWLDATWPISMRALATRLRADAYQAQADDGFLIDRVREGFVEGRFIERREIDETVRDPFGRETSIVRTAYDVTSFTAHAEPSLLELIDSSRGWRTAAERLSARCDYQLGLSPIYVDCLEWATALQATSSLEFTVVAVQVSAVALTDGVTAKMVVKGDNNLLGALKELVRGRRHRLEKVQLRAATPHRRGTVVLGVSGSLTADNTLFDDVVATARQALTSVRAVEL